MSFQQGGEAKDVPASMSFSFLKNSLSLRLSASRLPVGSNPTSLHRCRIWKGNNTLQNF
jgi:hypothetical protein